MEASNRCANNLPTTLVFFSHGFHPPFVLLWAKLILRVDMPLIERSALVPYSAEQMFALVDDIESYPEFLPWCHSSCVHKREANIVEASLEVTSLGVQKTFSTRNTLTPHSQITLALLDGPFKKLEGIWSFTQLGDDGCKVALHLEYEYGASWAHIAFGAVFSHIAGQLVDAFVGRANAVIGGMNG